MDVNETTTTETPSPAGPAVELATGSTPILEHTPNTADAEGTTPEVTEVPSESVAIVEHNYKYGEVDLVIDVPDDLRNTFKSAGLDADELVKELYDGEFGLKAETKDKLYAIYGKSIVDGYINGLKLQNDSLVASITAEQNAIKEANDKMWSAALEVVGGEEGWGVLEQYALTNFSDSELDEFNAVMSSGNQYAQRLALQDLKAKHTGVAGTGLDGMVPAGSPSASGIGLLTREEYIKVIQTSEYKANPAAYDAARRAAMAQGL